MLFLEVVGYYALVQSGSRAWSATRRRSRHIVRIVLLVVRGMGRRRPQGAGGGRPLVAERGAGGAAAPRSPAAAAAVRRATDSRRTDHHATTSATSTSPGTLWKMPQFLIKPSPPIVRIIYFIYVGIYTRRLIVGIERLSVIFGIEIRY